MNSAAHIDKTLDVIKKLFLASAVDIDALKEGEKITATGLAEKIGSSFCKKCYQNKAICACKGSICKKCSKKKDPKCSCETLGFEPLDGPQYYVVLKFLLNDYPGIEVTRGAQGGIRRKKTLPSAIIPASTTNSVILNTAPIVDIESESDDETPNSEFVTDLEIGEMKNGDDVPESEKDPLPIINT